MPKALGLDTRSHIMPLKTQSFFVIIPAYCRRILFFNSGIGFKISLDITTFYRQACRNESTEFFVLFIGRGARTAVEGG